MNNTEEKKLYYKTLTEILYRYMEFKLSFDNSQEYSYLNIIPELEEIYDTIINNIEQMEEVHFNSHEAITYVEDMILKELAKSSVKDIKSLKDGLSTKDISTLSIALYLKKYKDSIINELNKIKEIVTPYSTSETKFLIELINMFNTTILSTSISSSTVDNGLMPYFASQLRINYDEFSTANMYIFIMINLISQINETLSRFLESMSITDIQMRDVVGHLDCYNSHKDDLNALYSIDDLASSLTNLKTNLNAIINLLQEKNKKASLQLDVKS